MVDINPQMRSVGLGSQDPSHYRPVADGQSGSGTRLRPCGGFVRGKPTHLHHCRLASTHRRQPSQRGNLNCRQIDVWANRLTYWLSHEAEQKRIITTYRRHKNVILKNGFTAQIAEQKGWQRMIGSTPAGKIFDFAGENPPINRVVM